LVWVMVVWFLWQVVASSMAKGLWWLSEPQLVWKIA
jgi:hypothetical protein